MLKILGLFLVSGLAVGSLYGLAGIGLVVLRRSTGVLNLAYGAIAAASAMSAWQVAQWTGVGSLGWLAALGTGMLLSLTYGYFLSPPLSGHEPAVKAVASLGYMLIVLGLMGLLWNDDLRKLVLPTDAMAVTLLGVRVTLTRIVALGLSVGILIAMTLYLERTRTGLHMRALADNRSHAALLGIPIKRVETIAWGISGALAGATGLLFGSLVRLEPAVITFIVIPAIAAAVCGRLQSLPMTLAGGLLIGVVEAMLILYPPAQLLRSMTPFVIAALVILWLQRGRKLTFMASE